MNDDLISRSRLLRDPYFRKDRYPVSHHLRMAIMEQPAVDLEKVFKSLPYVKEALEMARADLIQVVRCKDCEWFNSVGCAIYIVDESDKPKENDFCSFGKRRAANVAGIDIADDIAGLDLEHMARFAMQQALQSK